MVLLTQSRYCSALHTCTPQLQTSSELPGMSPYRLGNKEHVKFGQAVLASAYPGLLCPWLCAPGAPLLQCPHSQGTEHTPLGLSVILGLFRLFARDFCVPHIHTYICKHTHLYRHTYISVICVCIYTHVITLSHHSCSALENFLTL